MTITFNAYGKNQHVEVLISSYVSTGNTAVVFVDLTSGEIFDIITVNFDFELSKGYCFIDINNSYGLLDIIEKNGLGEFCGSYCCSGFLKYPLYKINIEKIKKEL